MSSLYSICVSGSAPILYPTTTLFGLLYYNADDAIEIPIRYPYSGEWGEILTYHLLENSSYPMPFLLDIVWLSLVERKYYSLVQMLPQNTMIKFIQQQDKGGKGSLYSHIVIGMAPYGGLAVWFRGDKKSRLIGWYQAEETEVMPEDISPLNLTTISDYYKIFVENVALVNDNIVKNGLPARDLFENYMRQFTYRYLLTFKKWRGEQERWEPFIEEDAAPIFEYVEETLFDGTHDKLRDGGLLKYHEAGMPKKLAVKWYIKKSEYTAYLWFEETPFCNIFERFYGAHRDTKTDFIICIDAENKKYELALFRQGLKEPQIITENAYQLIVFKNKFEDYRSEDYNQQRGAWIW